MRSSASSSANRMTIGLGVCCCCVCGDIAAISFFAAGMSRGQNHDEGRSFSLAAVGRNRPPMALDDFTTNRQPDSSPVVLRPPVQALEDVENPVEVFFVEADAVVGDADLLRR